MKLLSLAVALLIAPSDATKLEQRAAAEVAFPKLPSGDSVTKLAAHGLDELGREIKRELHQVNSYKDRRGRVHTWERGLRRDIKRFNRDLIREGKREFGVDLSKNVYDPKFITDLIWAEYEGFVNDFKKHRGDYAREFDGFARHLKREADKAGLAQEAEESWVDADEADEEEQIRGPGGGSRGGYRSRVTYDPFKGIPECKEYRQHAWNSPYSQKCREVMRQRRHAEEMKRIMRMPFTRQVARAIPDGDQALKMIQHAFDEAARELKRPSGVREIANFVREVNGVLEHEARRLKLKVPRLPDPQDTASKVAKVVLALEKRVDDPKNARRLKRDLGREKRHFIRDLARTERDMKRSAEHAGINMYNPRPKDALKIIRGAKSEVARGGMDRDLREVARAAQRVGAKDITQASLKELVGGLLGAAEKVASGKHFDRDAHRAVRDVEREAEREVKRDVRRLEHSIKR